MKEAEKEIFSREFFLKHALQCRPINMLMFC